MWLLPVAFVLTGVGSALGAGTVVFRLNNTTDLTTAGSFATTSGGTTVSASPSTGTGSYSGATGSTTANTSALILEWDANSNTNQRTGGGTGATLAVDGVIIANPAAAVTIPENNGTFTIGLSGIDMSAATQDLTFSGGTVRIGPGVNTAINETWTVAAGRTLTLASAVGVQAGTNTLTLAGAGNVTFNGAIAQGTSSLRTVINGPTVAFNAANTTSGTTTITTGTLQIGGTGTLGTGVVTNNSALVFARTDASTVATVINGTGTLTQSGVGGAATLTGANGFTGAVNVNAGTLVANLSNNTVNPTTSALGNPQTARNINVNNGGTLQFGNGDTLGGATSAIQSTLVIAAGGTVTNNGASFNTLGNVVLNGGTLTGTGGSGNASYQMYYLSGTVTSGGTAASTISGTGTTTPGFHLGANTMFNVGATGSGASDLTVSGILIDQTGGQALAPGGLTKSGAGVLTFTAANTYTGNTVINAGTLNLSTGSIASNAINVTGTGTLTLGNAITLADTSTLSLVTGTALNLNGIQGTSETIASLVLNGTVEPAGVYSAAQLAGLSGANGITFGTSAGETLTVTAVPEPSTFLLGLIAVAGCCIWHGQRSRRASWPTGL